MLKRSRNRTPTRDADRALTPEASTPTRTVNAIIGDREITAAERKLRNERYQKQKDQLRRTKNVEAALGEDKKHKTKAAKRRYLNALRLKNVFAHIGKDLPEPGEALHCVFKGNNDGFDVLPAIIQHAGGTVGDVAIATLGFNTRNFEALGDLIEKAAICPVLFVCSVLHEARDPEACQQMAQLIRDNGGQFSAVRAHCKVMAIDAGGGNFYSVESSANLRSCRMAEQFVISNDRGLYEFHREWMLEIGEKTGH